MYINDSSNVQLNHQFTTLTTTVAQRILLEHGILNHNTLFFEFIILSTFLFYYLKKLITYIQIFFNFEYESKLNMIWNGIPTILLEKKCPIDLSKEETGFIIQLVKCIYSNVRLPNILLNRSISKINFYFLIERQFNGILIFSVMNLIKID